MKLGKLKWIGNIIMVVSLYFIIKTFAKMNLQSILQYINIKNISILLLLSISYSICVIFSSYNWKLILDLLSSKKVITFDTIYIYTKANLGKYLPGNVM